jgi:hypothetical protein
MFGYLSQFVDFLSGKTEETLSTNQILLFWTAFFGLFLFAVIFIHTPASPPAASTRFTVAAGTTVAGVVYALFQFLLHILKQYGPLTSIYFFLTLGILIAMSSVVRHFADPVRNAVRGVMYYTILTSMVLAIFLPTIKTMILSPDIVLNLCVVIFLVGMITAYVFVHTHEVYLVKQSRRMSGADTDNAIMDLNQSPQEKHAKNVFDKSMMFLGVAGFLGNLFLVYPGNLDNFLQGNWSTFSSYVVLGILVCMFTFLGILLWTSYQLRMATKHRRQKMASLPPDAS